ISASAGRSDMRALIAMETRNVRTPSSFGSKRRFLGLSLTLALAALPSRAFAQAAPGAEEEEEEGKAPAAKGTPKTPPTTPPPAAAPDPAAATAGAAGTGKVAPDQGYLEGRAEAESPNELISVVQKKTYTAAHKFELTLYPLMIQLNSKFVNTDGIGLAA